MTLSLTDAIVYDLETLPNVFSFLGLSLHGDQEWYFEISDQGRDDRHALWAWLNHWHQTQTPMVGFNNLAFDYPVLHFFWQNPDVSAGDICAFAQSIIRSNNRFESMIWQSDRLAPQIDLMTIHHFENRAKMTSLKALQFAMRSEIVMEMPLPFDRPMTRHQIDTVLYPYQRHDTSQTKKFAHYSMPAIQFRIELMDMLQGDVVNWNDTKIGAKFVEQRLGDDLCYARDPETGRRIPRQTIRNELPIRDVIFPFIKFRDSEFNRILEWLKTQTLRADEMTDRLKTKGVFTNVVAHVGGIDFKFGTGGMHGSVHSRVFIADEQYTIQDIDVSGMYPANMIANRLYPEHLGEKFVEVFSQLPVERAKYKKGTARNGVLKLGGNGTFGNTNNVHSVFLDAKVTMATTINGQLLICMLAEWLLTVPTLEIIQANTDGITYRIRRSYLAQAKALQDHWERYTLLKLEYAEYRRMWIRDVNSYIGEFVDGSFKQKGAFWFPRKFPDDLAGVWHKDFSAQVIIMAAVAHMTEGVDIERFVYDHADQFDFMLRAKCDRSSQLWIGDRQVQRITRYFVSTNGAPMKKVSPPAGTPGTWKRRNGISDAEFYAVLREVGSEWDERIHTKNRSKYETRETGIESGFLVTECNHVAQFDFESLNYQYYIDAARKLVIG